MIIEPLKQDRKMSSYLEEKPKKVLIVFWHGIGDVFQFRAIYEKLKKLYPKTQIDIAFAKGLDEETIIPEARLVERPDELEKEYDYTFYIHFPVEIPGMTKAELCCKEELGIEPISEYIQLPKFQNKLCAVHFCLTSLPHLANPDHDTAERIWNDILEAGWIPLESHFEHTFHNPLNAKFDFVDATVRRVKPKISTLAGLLQNCGAFIGVVSGNFHCAMSVMSHKNIAFLEKDIPVERFTDENIQTFDLKNYQGGIKEWLNNLEQSG